MASDEAVAAVLKMIAKSYPGRFEADADTARIWARLLADLDDRALLGAAVHHATQSKWPPSIAELREAAFGIVAGSVTALGAGEAWGLVVKAMRCYGLYRARVARDVLGEALWRCVQAMGGWRDLCLSEEPMADRAHFLRIYEQMASRDQAERQMLPEVRALTAQYALLAGGEPAEALPAGMQTVGAVLRGAAR